MKVYLLKLSIVAGIFCGVYAMASTYFPKPMNTMLFTSFVGVAITFGIGPDPKKMPNFLCSVVAGVVWGMIYFKCFEIAGQLGITGSMNMLVVVTVLTFVVCVVHLIILAGTWLDYLAVIFAALACFFAMGGQKPIMLVLAIWFGVFLAYSFGPVTKIFHREKEEEKLTEEPAEQ